MNRDVRRAVTVLLSVFMLLCSATAAAATRWDNPLPQGNMITDVAWNGVRYVAVTSGGVILQSTNGVQWSLVTSGTNKWLHAVRWTGTQFIAVGVAGTILTSADGLHWSRQSSGADRYINGLAVAQGLNLLVAVGNSGLVITSPDGVHWTTQISNAGDDWLTDVGWNGREFIAVGSRGSIIGSADGVNWSRREPADLRTVNEDGSVSGPSFDGIAWSSAQGRWVVVSENGCPGGPACILASSDGITWTVQATNPEGLRAVIWDAAQGRFVVVGDNGLVRTSNDGLSWNAPNRTRFVGSLQAVAAGAGGYVAAGKYGLILTTANPDGVWTRRGTSPLNHLGGVATNGLGYVAVGEGIIFNNSNAATSRPTSVTGTPVLQGVAWGRLLSGLNGYLAVGNGGAIVTSTDGANWTRDPYSGADLRDVVRAADGAWIAVGADGTILRNEGAGWITVRSQAGETIGAISRDSRGLIAVGASFDAAGAATGIVLTSANGTDWTGNTFAGQDFRGVATGNSGRRVVVGAGGNFMTEVNSRWSPGNIGNSLALNDVTWDGSRFIAVGDKLNTFTSPDGLRWEKQTVSGNRLTGVAAIGPAFVAVGEGGTIVYDACPCAVDDQATTTMNTRVKIAVLANDKGDNLQVRAFDAKTARGGAVTLNGDGTLNYSPARDFSGTDIFNYTIRSGSDTGMGEDTALVAVTVSGRSSSSGGGGGGALGGTLLGCLFLAALRRARRANTG